MRERREKASLGCLSRGITIPPGTPSSGVHLVSPAGQRHQWVTQSMASISSTGTVRIIRPRSGGLARLRSSPLSYTRQTREEGKLKAKGDLAFLNTWTYELGDNILTPFGRQQLFDLAVGMRLKYGVLLESFPDPKPPTAQRLPIIRTESQDRMLASATNSALGFLCDH